MQMIWLLGASASAKKVHFNLNGPELRGFPIKARSGQSSILYANPLTPKAAACFCLCPAVITRGQRASGTCLSKWTTTWSDQTTLSTATASTPVIMWRGLRLPTGKTPTFHHISLLAQKESLLFSVTSTYLRGSWVKLIGDTQRLVC